jgi:poly(hydroxyalkanoate) granule-associated protein
MVKKTTQSATDNKAGPQLAGTVKESASQIWLAGLGAFAKAQEEGGKVFDTLVKEGLAIQRKTQAAAEEKLSEATNRMASMATDISSKASGQWDKLENIFEERVAKALDELNRNVAKLSAKQTGKTSAARTGANAATKPSAKRSAPRKSA